MDSTNWDAPLQTDELDLERLVRLDQRITELDERWNRERSELDANLQQLDADYRNLRDALRTEVSDWRDAQGTANVLRWMFFFWVLTLVPLAGLMLFLVR